ncbi:MAG: methylmalonyl-CoA mutase [Chloroflexota bacterium]|nr:MAG: methylmalonyl-CoA mutase [Chloroflexota bacterium]
MTEQRIRVLVCKLNFDAHDRGGRYISRKLMEAGMETIFSRVGTAKEAVEVALQEDVDAIGFSILTGAHLLVAAELIDELKKAGMGNVPVIMGGLIPTDDIAQLKALGVAGVFTSVASPEEAVAGVRDAVLARRAVEIGG